MAGMTMTIERVLAFNGLDVLVARDEGLFAAEGLDLQIATPSPAEMRSTAGGDPRHRGQPVTACSASPATSRSYPSGPGKEHNF